MSIFRTIKKIRGCEACNGTGVNNEGTACLSCEGTGQVEVLARVSQAAAGRAAAAARDLPPRERQAARERLQDHEPELKGGKDLPKKGKESKVGSDVIDED